MGPGPRQPQGARKLSAQTLLDLTVYSPRDDSHGQCNQSVFVVRDHPRFECPALERPCDYDSRSGLQKWTAPF